jgi:hypothetical protein
MVLGERSLNCWKLVEIIGYRSYRQFGADGVTSGPVHTPVWVMPGQYRPDPGGTVERGMRKYAC